MAVRERAFSAVPVALARSLCRMAERLYRVAEYCPPADAGRLQIALRVRNQCRRLLTAAAATGQSWLKVAVVGDFDAGKSTLISALAGQELLPMHPNPATAVVTWVTHGAEEAYYVCPGDGAPLRAIAGDDFRHLRHGGMAEATAATVDHLEVHLPLPLLSRGVVLLDTPGFDNGPGDTARASEVIAECDGLLLCTPAVHPLSERDLALLRALFAPEAGEALFRPEQVFLVLTFADAGQFRDDPPLMAALITGLRTRLVGQAGLDQASADELLTNRCVPVSGKWALRARQNQDRAGEALSGIALLEERLDGFFSGLQEARICEARAVLDAATAFGPVVCRDLRAQLRRTESRLQERLDEGRPGRQQVRHELDRLQKHLVAGQRDLEERLPRAMSRWLEQAAVGAVADQAPLGIAAISKAMVPALLRSDTITRVTEILKTSLLNLFVTSAKAAGAPVLAPADWAPVVEQGLAWFAGALESRLITAVAENTPVVESAKPAVGAALRAADSRRLDCAFLPELFAELKVRLQEPINAQILRAATEPGPGMSDLEAEVRWAQSALHALDGLEAEFAGQDREADGRPVD